MQVSSAIAFVRARMDEIAFEQGDMIPVAQDDRNLDNTIGQLLPEAVQVVVLASPAHLLESDSVETQSAIASGPVDMSVDDDFLRMVYMKASDSDVFVTNPVPFNSPEARMQANPYTKGTPDAPVVVLTPLNAGAKFTYYSLGEAGSVELAYISKPEIVSHAIFCPVRLEEAVLNELTAMVLETYNDQRSQLFHQKVTAYLAQ